MKTEWWESLCYIDGMPGGTDTKFMGESETEKTTREMKLISSYKRLDYHGKNIELHSLDSGDRANTY